jgi:hypothetical protein
VSAIAGASSSVAWSRENERRIGERMETPGILYERASAPHARVFPLRSASLKRRSRAGGSDGR